MDRVVSIDKEISLREQIEVKTVLDKYSIIADKIERIRSVYKITCKNKVYCLKKISDRQEKVVKGMLLTEHLRNNGFTNIATYNKATDGKEYVKLKKNVYYLMEWIDGRESNLEDFDELKKAIKLLANFHKATIDFKCKDIEKKEDWLEDFYNQKNEIIAFKNTITKKKIKTSFDVSYEQVVDRYINLIDTAIELLEASSYSKIKESKSKTICHNSFYYQNILVDTNNTLYLIDLDSVIYDIWVYDLAKLIRRILYKKCYSWDFEIAKGIIQEYMQVNSLSKIELEILLAFLIFPHKFWKLGKKRYQKRKEWSEEKYLNKLERINRVLEKQEEFIKKYSIEYLDIQSSE